MLTKVHLSEPKKTIFQRSLIILSSFLMVISLSSNMLAQSYVFNTPGAGSFVVPAGCHTKVTIELYGAGGGGGGANTAAAVGGGAGGAGGYAKTTFNVNPGDVIPYTVGAGGNGGGPAGNGGSGGQTNLSTFSTMKAFGGTGGNSENGGGTGGAGGTASAWAYDIAGTAGSNADLVNGGTGGTNGGADGGVGGAGGALGVDGANGGDYGAGGGGGGPKSGVNTNGGNGANGAVVITLGAKYTSIAAGAWTSAASWDPMGIPPFTLPCGDSIIIDHDISFATNINTEGVMVVQSNGNLNGNKKISIKEDGIVHNAGLINTSNEVHVDGYLYNDSLVLAKKLHSDGYICNSGTIRLEPGEKFDHHGGIVECCGTILADVIKFHANAGVSGHQAITNCQDYCNTTLTGPPSLDIGGIVTTAEALANILPAVSLMQADSITFCIYSFLPVELGSYSVSCLSDDVFIKWETLSETENDYFTIERSRDGITFEKVAEISGNGTTSSRNMYTWLDDNSQGGVAYYRLSQTDFNGEVEYLDIRSVNCGEVELSIYPNPFHTEVNIVSKYSGAAVFMDLTGKVVKQQVFDAGKNQVQLDNVQSGTYVVRIILADGTSIVRKITRY